MKRVLYFLALLFLFTNPALAQNTDTEPQKPADLSAREILIREELRAPLLAAWEKNMSGDPDTHLFEKTGVSGVYNIQTDLLPYKGRIKVTNFLIRPYTPTADYDRRIAYGGIVEFELLDRTTDAINKDSLSYKEWEHLSWFNYDKIKNEWFPTSAWKQHFPTARYAKLDTPLKSDDPLPSMMDVTMRIAEAVFGVFFLILMGVAGVYGHRQQKMRKAMDEQTGLLREILATLKERNH